MQLYIDADLNDDFHSINSFKKILEEYKKENPSFNYSEEKIIEEGWVATFLDRWELNRSKYKFEWSEFDKTDNYDIVLFLSWISDQKKHSRLCVVLKNLNETLEKWRELYPNTPNVKWFIENRFIFSDEGIHYAYSDSIGNEDVCQALAKMWIYHVNYEDKNDVERWFEIARQLKATSQVLKYFEYKDKQLFLEKLIELYIDEKYIINNKREEKRIEKQYWLENPDYLKENRDIKSFSSDFLIEKLEFYDRRIFDLEILLHIRKVDIHFIIDCIVEYLDMLSDECYIKIAPALCNLHESGIFNYFTFHSAETFMELCSYEETQFIGLQLLLERCIPNNADSPDQFISYFIELIRDLINSGGKFKSGLNANTLAQVIHLCSEEALIGVKSINQAARVYKLLLTRLIKELVELPFQLNKMLPDMLHYFEQMCKQKNDVSWSRAFHLVNMCINSWYYGDSALDKDENYNRIQNILIECYKSIFECTSAQKKATFVSEDFLFDDVWIDIYNEQISNSLDERIEFLKPININKILNGPITSDNEKENQKFNLRHMFRINLKILAIIIHGTNKAMELEKEALVEILTSFKNDNDDLFEYSDINIFGCHDIMKNCISLINPEIDIYKKIIDQLESYSVPKLLLFLHYSNNEKLSEIIQELIKKKIEPDCMDVYGNDQAIDLALQYKIKELYPFIQEILVNYLNRMEGEKSFQFDNNRINAYNKLNRLFYCWEKYEDILKGSNSFYKVLVYIESDKYRDLDKAERLGYELINKAETECSGAYINLIYTHVLQIENAIKGNNENLTNNIHKKILKLSRKVEKDKISDWNMEQKECYCSNLIYERQLLRDDIKEFIDQLNKNLNMNLNFEEYRKENASVVTENISIDYENLKKYLWKYMSMNSKDKSRIHYELKSIENLQDADETLLLECIIKACYSIEAYGPQLAVGQRIPQKDNKQGEIENIKWKYYEDYITQLYREMFNLAFTDVYNLAINDQEQTGSTGKAVHNGSKKGCSEIDLTIKQGNIRVGILEALVLEGCKKEQIKDHICKAIGNNIQQCKVSVVLIYGTSNKQADLWAMYKDYNNVEMTEILKQNGYIVEETTEFNKSPLYDEAIFRKIPLTENIIYQKFRNPNGREQHLYHIYIDLSKDSVTKMRLIVND